MIFILKPSKHLYGKGLKKWYRRVNYGLRGNTTLPPDWADRPVVKVPIELLHSVMSILYETANNQLLN